MKPPRLAQKPRRAISTLLCFPTLYLEVHVMSHTTEFSYAAFVGANADAPSWQRQVVVFAAVIIVGFGFGVVGEALGSSLLIGSYLLTGSAFLAFALYWFSFAATLIASFYAGSAVGRYILDRHVDRDWAALKRGVTKLFGSSRKATERVIHKARYTVTPAKGEA